jgi:N-acetylglucosaminyldiphosphoundecaprenol N-acetyl-beta-D-mannosaminyltransferase
MQLSEASKSSNTNILGVRISAIDMDSAVHRIEHWVRHRERTYVCVTGVHGLIECQRDEVLRQIHNAAGMVTPDGMPLVYLSRAAGQPHVRRVYGPDLMLAVCERTQGQGTQHFLYGSTNETLERLSTKLRERFPDLNICGSYSPPFRALTADESDSIADRINSARPDIVWVGLSTPKQERWMAANRTRLNAPVLIGVGAAFDFHAGNVRQAPRWMQASCLEWLFRMLMEPRRLWRRYCFNNPLFLALLVAQVTRLKSFNPENSAHLQCAGRQD